MDDQLNDKIKSILSDPDSLQSILAIASAFGAKKSDNNEAASSKEEPKNTTPEAEPPDNAQKVPEDSGQTPNPAITALSPLSALQNASPIRGKERDDRVNLLLSIKPFLNDKKQQRVDSLVKALNAAKLISTYKDLDIFSKFGL